MKSLLVSLNARFIHTSLALRYLKASLLNAGFPDTDVVDFTINDRLDYIIDEIYQHNPDIVCFSTYIWNIEPTIKISSSLKKIQPNLHIILGGPEVSYNPERVLKQCPAVDYIVLGEGEETLPLLVTALSSHWAGYDICAIRGLAYRKDGVVKSNGWSALLDPDSIPFPYAGEDLMPNESQIIYYESSRGCPHRCSYCISSVNNGLRLFPLDRVKSELAMIMSHPFREIKFVDRNFTAVEKRAREIMEFILDGEGENIFHFEVCADTLSEDMMIFLDGVPKGRFNFEIGVQSANVDVLRSVNRHTDLARLQDNVRRLVRSDRIQIHMDLIAGLPGEDMESIARSFNWVYDCQPHYIQLGFLKILPGAPITEAVDRFGYIYTDYPPYEVLANDVLDHMALIQLKNVEIAVDKIYNSRIVEHLLTFLVDRAYNGDAWAFFDGIALFMKQSGESLRQGSRREDIYNIMIRYTKENHSEFAKEACEWARLDYLCNHCSWNLPSEIGSHNIPASSNAVLLNMYRDDEKLQMAAHRAGFESLRDGRNHLMVHYFILDPMTGEMLDTPIPVVFCYDRNSKVFIEYCIPGRSLS